MKRLILILTLILCGMCQAAKFHYQDPDGNFAICTTNNQAHIAIMEAALLNDCELEAPVDSGLPISDEDKEKLTKEEKDALKVLKKEHNGRMYTVLKRVPNFKADPNEI